MGRASEPVRGSEAVNKLQERNQKRFQERVQRSSTFQVCNTAKLTQLACSSRTDAIKQLISAIKDTKMVHFQRNPRQLLFEAGVGSPSRPMSSKAASPASAMQISQCSVARRSHMPCPNSSYPESMGPGTRLRIEESRTNMLYFTEPRHTRSACAPTRKTFSSTLKCEFARFDVIYNAVVLLSHGCGSVLLLIPTCVIDNRLCRM